MNVDHYEEITSDGEIIALIVRADFSIREEGARFFTSPDASQQVGYLQRKAKAIIRPHVHHQEKREITQTHETLIVKKGLLRVDLYTKGGHLVASRTLRRGDTILLMSGGHGFEMMEDTELIEIKQGPYLGSADKFYI